MEYLYTHRYTSPLGDLFLAVDRAGSVHRVAYYDFSLELPPDGWETNKYACGETEYQLDEYFQGKRARFTLSLWLTGTEFQQSVWKALQKVEYGDTTTYKELARRIGRRHAARAVGNAVGSNPVALIVPCHRVVRATGTVGDYARRSLSPDAGRRIKRSLLEIERRRSGPAIHDVKVETTSTL